MNSDYGPSGDVASAIHSLLLKTRSHERRYASSALKVIHATMEPDSLPHFPDAARALMDSHLRMLQPLLTGDLSVDDHHALLLRPLGVVARAGGAHWQHNGHVGFAAASIVRPMHDDGYDSEAAAQRKRARFASPAERPVIVTADRNRGHDDPDSNGESQFLGEEQLGSPGWTRAEKAIVLRALRRSPSTRRMNRRRVADTGTWTGMGLVRSSSGAAEAAGYAGIDDALLPPEAAAVESAISPSAGAAPSREDLSISPGSSPRSKPEDHHDAPHLSLRSALTLKRLAKRWRQLPKMFATLDEDADAYMRGAVPATPSALSRFTPVHRDGASGSRSLLAYSSSRGGSVSPRSRSGSGSPRRPPTAGSTGGAGAFAALTSPKASGSRLASPLTHDVQGREQAEASLRPRSPRTPASGAAMLRLAATPARSLTTPRNASGGSFAAGSVAATPRNAASIANATGAPGSASGSAASSARGSGSARGVRAFVYDVGAIAQSNRPHHDPMSRVPVTPLKLPAADGAGGKVAAGSAAVPVAQLPLEVATVTVSGRTGSGMGVLPSLDQGAPLLMGSARRPLSVRLPSEGVGVAGTALPAVGAAVALLPLFAIDEGKTLAVEPLGSRLSPRGSHSAGTGRLSGPQAAGGAVVYKLTPRHGGSGASSRGSSPRSARSGVISAASTPRASTAGSAALAGAQAVLRRGRETGAVGRLPSLSAPSKAAASASSPGVSAGAGIFGRPASPRPAAVPPLRGIPRPGSSGTGPRTHGSSVTSILFGGGLSGHDATRQRSSHGGGALAGQRRDSAATLQSLGGGSGSGSGGEGSASASRGGPGSGSLWPGLNPHAVGGLGSALSSAQSTSRLSDGPSYYGRYGSGPGSGLGPGVGLGLSHTTSGGLASGRVSGRGSISPRSGRSSAVARLSDESAELSGRAGGGMASAGGGGGGSTSDFLHEAAQRAAAIVAARRAGSTGSGSPAAAGGSGSRTPSAAAHTDSAASLTARLQQGEASLVRRLRARSGRRKLVSARRKLAAVQAMGGGSSGTL